MTGAADGFGMTMKKQPPNQKRAVAGGKAAPVRPLRGGVLAALRRSPLVRTDLRIVREIIYGRDVDL
jgi:hypothetical protein